MALAHEREERERESRGGGWQADRQLGFTDKLSRSGEGEGGREKEREGEREGGREGGERECVCVCLLRGSASRYGMT